MPDLPSASPAGRTVRALVPPGSLVLLVGVSGSGKSTLATKAFPPSSVLSSDAFRGMLSDDPADQSATTDAFELLHHALLLRLRRGVTTVVDATNVKAKDRASLLHVAAETGRGTLALVFDVPLDVALERNAARDRVVPERAVRRQHDAFTASLTTLASEVDSVVTLGLGDVLEVVSSLPGLDLAALAPGFTVSTPAGPVSVDAQGFSSALEVLSQHSVPARALSYLPPTMSPVESSRLAGFLEHPAEAFSFFRSEGVVDVVLEEKHMGSRATFLLCRDASVAARFGLETLGAAWTRRGRPFFNPDLLPAVLARLDAALRAAGVDEDWALLDAEVLPWSFRRGLVSEFAAVAASGLASVPAELEVLARAHDRGLDVGDLASRASLLPGLATFSAAYQQFCWPTNGLDGVEVAPFHLLATSSGVTDLSAQDHLWQVGLADRMAEAAPGFVRPTRFRHVLLDDAAACAEATEWWLGLTSDGGEGVVVKPTTGPVTSSGLTQPGVKVRGREYLHLIYGSDYLEPHRLKRLRKRSLKAKRSLALREWGLGQAALEGLVAASPLEDVYRCALGVLALEASKLDPRL